MTNDEDSVLEFRHSDFVILSFASIASIAVAGIALDYPCRAEL
jgi:hypothetical protein